MTAASQIFDVGPGAFAQAFGEPLSDYVAGRVERRGMRCRAFTPAERDDWLLRVMATLLEQEPAKAGKGRMADWENGWAENLEAFASGAGFSSLIPRYFGKYAALRVNGDLVEPASPLCEYDMLATVEDWLFDAFLRDAPAVYEFGCGTGHNLFRAREANPSARLYGCDWAGSSNRLVEAVAASGTLGDLRALHFDLFHPDPDLGLEPGAAVYTVAALEQTGDRFGPFLDYLLANKPSVCVHIEPVGELLDPSRLLDYLSLRYFAKRNYLSGFLDELKRREAEGQLAILKAQRTNIGSLYIEGYAAVVWKPL